MGYQHGTNWSRWTEKDWQDLLDRYGTLTEAAKTLGLSHSALSLAMKRWGISIRLDRARRKKKPSLLDKYGPLLKHLASIGWSCPRIVAALELPVRDEQVRRWLRDRGAAVRVKRGAPQGVWNVCWVDGDRSKPPSDRYKIVPAPVGYSGQKKANGWVFEHRLVMEKKISRHLRPEEVVHHIDNDGRNNDPGNLAIFPNQTAHLQHHYQQWLAAYTERLADLQELDRQYIRNLDWSETDD